MLAVCTAAAAAFVPSSAPPPLAPAARRSAATPIRLSFDSEERSESAKAAGIAALSGSLASAPVKASALLATLPIKAPALAQWEFSTGALAVQLALFGVVYRYAARSDFNDTPKRGTVFAFALCRALSSVQPSFSDRPEMFVQLLAYFGESVFAFGVAAASLGYAWKRGWVLRLPAAGLPPYYPEVFRDGPPPPYYDGPMDYREGGPPPPYYRDRAYSDGPDQPPF